MDITNKKTLIILALVVVLSGLLGGQLSLTFIGKRSEYKEQVRLNNKLQKEIKAQDLIHQAELNKSAELRKQDLRMYNASLQRADSINKIRAHELSKYKKELSKYNNHTVKQLEDEAERIYREYLSLDDI